MIRREIELPVSPGALWQALTDPSAASSWFGTTVEWAPEPGSPARFSGGDGGDRDGRVEAVVPERQLRFRWWPEDDVGACSEVEYLLEPLETGVRLTVTERLVGRAAAEARASAASSGTWDVWDSRLAGMWCAVATARGARLARS